MAAAAAFTADSTDLMTMTRHVLNNESQHPEATGDLTILLTSIQVLPQL
jgi:fructose-1,6-bisphosphatase I